MHGFECKNVDRGLGALCGGYAHGQTNRHADAVKNNTGYAQHNWRKT